MQEPRSRHSASSTAAAAQLVRPRRSFQQLRAGADDPHTERKISMRPPSTPHVLEQQDTVGVRPLKISCTALPCGARWPRYLLGVFLPFTPAFNLVPPKFNLVPPAFNLVLECGQPWSHSRGGFLPFTAAAFHGSGFSWQRLSTLCMPRCHP
eukprot:scaffold9686_cov40-Phaeocystis_antarctica.AAC.1